MTNEEPARLPIHPLIAGLASAGLEKALGNAQASLVAARDTARLTTGPDFDLSDPDIDKFGIAPQSPQLVVFAGYLGGRQRNTTTTGPEWQVMFLDMTGSTWMIVPFDKILLHSRVEDDSAAYGLRDMIWVNSD